MRGEEWMDIRSDRQKGLGGSVDYLLSDSVVPGDDGQYRLWSQLMNGRTEDEKALAVNMFKLMFGYLDKQSGF